MNTKQIHIYHDFSLMSDIEETVVTSIPAPLSKDISFITLVPCDLCI